ncbi:MAG: hypothetical protein JSS07_11835 [Proteobacteria bacterium]|nr:hypothetical protein [Pseudomonadota bacterium]
MSPSIELKYKLISASLAFILWGTWTYYINDGTTRISSAFSQGIASLIITFLMVRAVSYFYKKFANGKFRLILPALLTISVTGCCLVSIHYIVGTKYIVLTVLPPLIIAFLFCLFTTNHFGRR